jgi:tRNA-binding protein
MRVGTIISAEVFEEAKNPAYKMTIDFGDYGIKKTSAQITKLYTPQELIGNQIVAVINFPKKQIATIMSECLVLRAVGDNKEVTLISPDKNIKNGTRIG